MTRLKLFTIILIGLFVSGTAISEEWKKLVDSKGATLSVDLDSINTYNGFVVGISKQELKELDPESYLPYIPFLYECKSGRTVGLFRNDDNDFRLNGARIESPWIYSDTPFMKKVFNTALPKYCGMTKSKEDLELPLQLTDSSLFTFFPKHLDRKGQKITTWIKMYSVVTAETKTSTGQRISRTKVRLPEDSYIIRETINCQTGAVKWHEIISNKNGRTTSEKPDAEEIIDPPGSAGRANIDMLCSMTN